MIFYTINVRIDGLKLHNRKHLTYRDETEKPRG